MLNLRESGKDIHGLMNVGRQGRRRSISARLYRSPTAVSRRPSTIGLMKRQSKVALKSAGAWSKARGSPPVKPHGDSMCQRLGGMASPTQGVGSNMGVRSGGRCRDKGGTSARSGPTTAVPYRRLKLRLRRPKVEGVYPAPMSSRRLGEPTTASPS